MKTFFISAGEQLVSLYNLDERGTAYQSEHICDVINAETRGKARAKFCRDHGLTFMERLFIRELHTGPNDHPDDRYYGEWPEAANAYRAAHEFFGLIEVVSSETHPDPNDPAWRWDDCSLDDYNTSCIGHPTL